MTKIPNCQALRSQILIALHPGLQRRASLHWEFSQRPGREVILLHRRGKPLDQTLPLCRLEFNLAGIQLPGQQRHELRRCQQLRFLRCRQVDLAGVQRGPEHPLEVIGSFAGMLHRSWPSRCHWSRMALTA
jgi:hypothetical protein